MGNLFWLTDAEGRPIRLCMTVGPVRDQIGAAAVLGSLRIAVMMPAGSELH
jgi:hypothetical protein